MQAITTIDDLKRIYARKVPRMFFDYTESGSWNQQTFRENSTDFEQIRFRQRVAVDITNRSLQSEMAGRKVAMPLALAPVGLTGMQSADGEIKAAKAANAMGVPFTLSTMSICSIEDVAEATQAPFWFQLYVMKDFDFMKRLMLRAKDAHCDALVVTLDLQVLGQRHKDIKNGLSAPPKLTLSTMLNLASKWQWGLEMLGTKRRQFGNIVGHVSDVEDTSSLSSWIADQFDPQLDWKKIEEIRDFWGGRLILKGILDPEDAKMAAKIGADAIVVSNHGGRQLDGSLSSIRALEPIIEAIGDQSEIHFDGGIRCGQDALKAIALGARGVYIGRSYIYGLGAMGELGVCKALEILEKEMDTTMALCGERDIRNFGRKNLLVPKHFSGDWQE